MFPFLTIFSSTAQSHSDLPKWGAQHSVANGDWLSEKKESKATFFETEGGKLIFSNGVISRTFSLTPNGATVGLDLLANNESYLRSVRPEAEVEINGIKFSIGDIIIYFDIHADKCGAINPDRIRKVQTVRNTVDNSVNKRPSNK